MFRAFSFPFRRAPVVTRAWGQRMLVRFIVAVPPVLGPRFEQLPWGPLLSGVGAVPPPAPAAASDTSNVRAHKKNKEYVICARHGARRRATSCSQMTSGQWECCQGDRCEGAQVKVVCAAHGAKRLATVMVQKSEGVWECSPMDPCNNLNPRPEGTPSFVLCAQHGSTRRASHCVQITPGRWECSPGDPCKESAVSSSTPALPVPSFVLCARHASRRRAASCIQMTSGQWECHQEDQCEQKVVCATHGVKRLANVMKKTPEGWWECNPLDLCKNVHLPVVHLESVPLVRCGVHGSIRALINVVEVRPGEYECQLDDPCQVTSNVIPSLHCAIHGTRRKRSFLKEVSPGRWECLPNDSCRSKQGMPKLQW